MSMLPIETADASATSRVVVDLAAVRHNVRVLRAAAPDAEYLAVVKADAYGHGGPAVARAALEAGASWLGVAQLGEALTLRRALADAEGTVTPSFRMLAWLFAPGAPVREAIEADIDLSAGTPGTLDEIAEAARAAGRPGRVHLKVDTGMSRAGALPEDVPALLDRAVELQDSGELEVVGLWSHLARADDPGCGATEAQDAALRDALAQAHGRGLRPLVHLAASGGLLWHPGTHHDLVRGGIAMYGLSPDPSVATAQELGLRPALRWEARLVLVKRLPAGSPVSYGGTEVVREDTWVGVVPVGYADGVPRHASARGPVRVGSRTGRVLGRVCMDQVVVDLGSATDDRPPARAGDLAVLIAGDDPAGPSAEDWAQAADTIGYEIVTRVGSRVPRVVVDSDATPDRTRGEHR